jgi:hypothetical protein
MNVGEQLRLEAIEVLKKVVSLSERFLSYEETIKYNPQPNGDFKPDRYVMSFKVKDPGNGHVYTITVVDSIDEDL